MAAQKIRSMLLCIVLATYLPVLFSFNSLYKSKVGIVKSRFYPLPQKQTLLCNHQTHLPLYFRVEGTEPDRRGSITLIEPEHSDVEDESDDEESDETDGEDEYEDEPAVKKPSIFRKLSRGIVPIAASVGFAISPSPSLVGRIAGATVGGVGGFIARKIVLESLEADSNNGGKEFSVHPKVHAAIANLPQENLLYMDQQDLEELARLFRVPESELSFFYTHVLSEAILRSVSLPSMDLTELSEVMDYVDSIGFSRKEVGDAFTLAAIRIGEQIKTDNKVVYGANSFKVFIQASKAFFLADKLMGSLKGFYGKRVQVALSYFSQDQYQDTITEACKSLFRKCIESVLTDPTSYTKEEVEALRNFLTTSSPIVSTLRPADMESMVFEGIQLLLDQDVTKVHPLAARANVVKLVNAQKVLGWSSQELFSTIETKTMPVFKRIANSAVTAIVENPQRAEEISKMLEDGMKNLQVDKNKARNVLMNLIYGVHKDYLEQLKSVYDATKGQLEPVYRIMLSYAHTHSALDRLVQPLMEGFQLPLPGAPFSIEVRGDMYEELLQNGKLINGKDDHLLDLTDREKELVKEQMAIPKIVGWVTQCIEENNFNEFARDAYMKMLKEYNIESEYWEATTVDFYYEEVSKVANSRSVPTIEDMTRLASIKSFLQCSDVAARRVHLILFGVKYLKALTEAMTPSGIITEDYVAGLDRLRDRLLLSQEDAELLMSVAIRQQLGPLVKDIADIWKHNTDASYRREKERGEQQAKAEKMREPISSPDNVFGFLEMGAGKKTGGPNNYMQQGVDLKTRAEFPITAVGFTSEEDLIGMFKHFLITRVAEPDPAIKSRYNEVEDAYAKILGIDAESQMKLKESLAFSAFKNLLLNVLASKDKVEPKDIQQFIVLREGFRLEKEAAETVYNDAVQAALLDHTARVLASKESEVTPEKARTYREQVQSLGFGLREVGLSGKALALLFALEVQYLVDNDMADELPELEESYDIPEQRAGDIVEAVAIRYIDQLLNVALLAAQKYEEAECIAKVKEILKYADFVSRPVRANARIFSEEDKKRLISFYLTELESALDEGEEAVGDVAAKKDHEIQLLKDLIDLSEDYVTPGNGMRGLLGTMPEDTVGNDATKGKKNWAWG